MEFNPAPDAVMQDGDQLVVLGRPASLKELGTGGRTGDAVVSARILDGAALAAAIREELQARASRPSPRATGRPPGLGIVLVGAHAPSEIYVRNKLKAAVGHRLPRRPVSPAGHRDARPTSLRRRPRLERRATSTTASSCRTRCRRDGSGASQAVFDVDRPGKGRGRVHARQRRPARRRIARRWRRARRRASSSCWSAQAFPSPARTPSSSAAATSSASRWRCCCCTSTPR